VAGDMHNYGYPTPVQTAPSTKMPPPAAPKMQLAIKKPATLDSQPRVKSEWPDSFDIPVPAVKSDTNFGNLTDTFHDDIGSQWDF
jgi:hypothetical protein